MSSKQLRKLQARSGAGAAGPPVPPSGGAGTGEEPEADDSDEAEPGAADASAPRRPGFAALLGDGEDGSEEEDEGEAAPAQPAPAPAVEVREPAKQGKAKQKKKKKKQGGKSGGAAAAAAADDEEDDDDALLDRLAAASGGGAAAGDAVVAGGAAGGAGGEPAASVLAMVAADFSAEGERRRSAAEGGARAQRSNEKGARTAAVKARGAHEGLTAHHRRLLLIEPSKEEQWLRPEGCAEMVAGEDPDGAAIFSVRSPPAHQRLRAEFAMLQASQDLEELQWFVREHPFCVEALLALADVCRAQGEHEQAFQLTRRAVYAVECGFAPGFSPLRETGAGKTPRRPRVALELPAKDEPAWPGWLWLAALFTYMTGLQRQGLSRTAVEVCKLLLAMLLPRDPLHVLVHLDLLCLAAGQHRLLELLNLHLLPQHVPCEPGTLSLLDLVLPNFAYSCALASQLAFGRPPELAAVSRVTVAAATPALDGSAGGREAASEDEEEAAALAPHAALMRALLLFPQVVRPLLEAAGVRPDAPAHAASPCRRSWQELLSRSPFAEASSFRHKRHFLAHALVADAYVRHCARRWLSEALLLPWLHACAGRLSQMCESSVFRGELDAARLAWSGAPLAVGGALAADYASFSTSEVGPDWQLPRILLQAGSEPSAGLLQNFGPPAGAVGGGEGDGGGGGEEAELQRALRASLAAEEARQRRELVAQQDAEYRESLSADLAREAGLLPNPDAEAPVQQSSGGSGGRAVAGGASEELVAQLVDMGFAADAAREALVATNGNLEAAVDRLAS